LKDHALFDGPVSPAANPSNHNPKKNFMNPVTHSRLAVTCFLLLILTAGFCKPFISLAQKPANYNVLFIAVDDMNERASVFGYPEVITPNLQRLADRGVVFKRAYCQFPMCNASRTSVLSGWRPDKTNVFNNDVRPRSIMGPDVKFLPEYFRMYGYHTERVGKIMHEEFEDDIIWDYAYTEIVNKIYSVQPIVNAATNVEPGLWWVTSLPYDSTPNELNATQMIQRMQLQTSQPFFLALGLTVHNPFYSSLKYWNMYGDSSVQQLLPVNKNGDTSDIKGNGSGNIELPSTPLGDRDDVPSIAFRSTKRKASAEWQNTIHAYYAKVSEMDTQLGLVLDEMDRQNLWGNTVVVLWSDHGQHLGEHEGSWLKNTLFEESNLSPLIMCVPGKSPGKTHALVELVDLYPTLTELCGLPKPEGMEGSSFVRLFDDKKAMWKRAVFSQVKRDTLMARSASTKQYRYNSWGSNGEELYNHTTDPFEYTNLAGDTAYAAILKKMRRFLSEGWVKSLPPAVSAGSIAVNSLNSLQKNETSQIKVYPNPVTGSKICIAFKSEYEDDACITIYDMEGKAIQTGISKIYKGSNQLLISLAGVVSGIYNLEIKGRTSKDNVKLVVKK
jgi:iduronate 2-sulfatase